jgi:2'-5' RNA ligase
VAVKPPEEVLDAVAKAVEPARSVRVGLRWEQQERYHLTLQFLGPVRELAPVVDGLAAAVGERSAFSFQLGGAGAFPKPGRARIVWMGAAAGGPGVGSPCGASRGRC